MLTRLLAVNIRPSSCWLVRNSCSAAGSSFCVSRQGSMVAISATVSPRPKPSNNSWGSAALTSMVLMGVMLKSSSSRPVPDKTRSPKSLLVAISTPPTARKTTSQTSRARQLTSGACIVKNPWASVVVVASSILAIESPFSSINTWLPETGPSTTRASITLIRLILIF